ncbi:MAG TPA: VOC family protein [Myxococcota bacterium]|nr:VOC family protein [Myxococcota bacterium]
MANNVAHFHFEADDPARARRFYEAVFGWRFRAFGPPDFFTIATGDDARPGIHGSLSRRPPGHGAGEGGFECTISVDDVDAIARAVTAAGGRIVMPRNVIHGVGEHIRFEDTEGNVVAALKYFDESQRG